MRGTQQVRRLSAGLAASIMAAGGLVVLSTSPAQAACTTWTVISVRGTDDGTRASAGTQLPTAVSAFKAKKGASTVTTDYVSYAATALGMTDTPFKGGYWNSLEEGKTALRKKITSRISACPTTKIALFGYSQGAHVVGDVVVGLSAAQRGRLQGVGLIGDPMFNPTLKGSRTGNTAKGGMFGRRASWPTGVFVSGICNKADQICAANSTVQSVAYLANPFSSPKEHLNYTKSTYSPVAGTSGAAAIGSKVATKTY